MLVLLPEASPRGIRPELVLGLVIANQVFSIHGGVDCVVTHLTDGAHMVGSQHYVGMAADLRSHHVPELKLGVLFAELQKALPPHYTVLWEDRDSPNAHFHLHYRYPGT